MRYVLCLAFLLGVSAVPTKAHALFHVVAALKDAYHAKHDSCFEKLRHHHIMKKAKHKQCNQCGGGCPTCH